jgi:CHAT domain-containing protein
MEAFEFAQRAKARSFLDMLAEAKIEPDAKVDPVLKHKKKVILAELVSIQKDIESGYEQQNFDRKKAELLSKKRNELDVEYTNLMLEIRKQNPGYAELEYSQPLMLSAAQQMLDGQTILLEYFIGETNSFLFAITNNDVHTYNLPDEKKLTEQILRMRESLQNPKDNRYQTISAVLYSELLSPIEDQLDKKIQILIAPDGPLNYLPFECLIGPKNTQGESVTIPFLALQFDIFYVPSMSVLKAVREKPSSTGQKELIAFANPMFIKSRKDENPIQVRGWASDLGPLPNAKKEVQEIATLYPAEDVSILVGEDASEKNVKTMKLDHYRKVHFASHGLIDEQKPEFSALLLSADQQREEDGFLTMREVFDLRLDADLVVLSACKTGLGENIRGEGVAGLARAFLVAGTSAVLVSLWDVYDRTTAEFMKAFYINMEQKNMSKAEALKQVRTAMIHSKSSHPYYWAPFVLIGKN